jgi:predicted DNA-binding transcriptional regulator AlpA
MSPNMTKNTQQPRVTLQENIDLFEETVLRRKMSEMENFIFTNGYTFALIDLNPSPSPTLISRKQVAEMIDISPTNMTHKRRSKGFPEPFITVDGFPLWKESDIKSWMESKGQ